MGAPSKRAKKIRDAAEFDVARLSVPLQSLKVNTGAVAWSLEDIVSARNQQMSGRFSRAADLAESMRTDDALFVAYENRLAPQAALPVALRPAKGARGASIASEAEALFGNEGVGIHPDTIADIHGCLVDHGVAFAYLDVVPRDDGSRVDVELKFWPIRWVQWKTADQCFVAMTMNGEETITHGDGRWVIFKKNEVEPWKHGALLPAALVWARHAFANRDWAKGSVAHGNAKVVGEMPEGMPLQDAEGALTSEASAFLELLKAIGSADTPVGIRPAGSKTEYITNSSTAWQVWSELVANAERAAARIYLGTDGTLGTNGGAPGVDIASLFGVATTKVQGDLECIERGILTGVIEPWCAMNFGDSSLAPKREYQIPDADEEARHTALAARESAFFTVVDQLKKQGFSITQDYIDALAAEHNVTAPLLPVETAKAPSIALGPTDIARVVSVNEARASAGLGPLTDIAGNLDPDGRLTVEEYSARKAAAAAAPSPPAPTPALRRV